MRLTIFVVIALAAIVSSTIACDSGAEKVEDPDAFPRRAVAHSWTDRFYDPEFGVVCYMIGKRSMDGGVGISCLHVDEKVAPSK